MRLLALLLLLANLGSLAWMRYVSAGEAMQRNVAVADGQDLGAGLELLQESPAPDAASTAGLESGAESAGAAEAETVLDDADDGPVLSAASVAVLDDTDVQQATAQCVALGPFANEDRASMAAVRLRDIGYRPTMRESGGQIRSGFWVYLPAFQNRRDAERAVADLKSKGIDDLFVVTGSEQLNAVSLGLFSRDELADRRAAAIGKLGYTPRIAERFRDSTVFWVEYRENPDNPLTPEDIGVFANALELPEKRSVVCGQG